MPGLGNGSLPSCFLHPRLVVSGSGCGCDLDNAFNHRVRFTLPLTDECTLTAISLFCHLFPCDCPLVSECVHTTCVCVSLCVCISICLSLFIELRRAEWRHAALVSKEVQQSVDSSDSHPDHVKN